MWGIGTYYELLGVDPDAPPAVIRDAYRRAARAHHPDRHGDAAAARMAEVNAAWQTLRDPASRRAYDLSLRDPIGARSPSGSSSVPPVRMEPRFNPLARYQNPPRFPWGLMGVMAVVGEGPEQEMLAELIAGQTALAMERTLSQSAEEAARVAMETEQMRSSLLSAVSQIGRAHV